MNSPPAPPGSPPSAPVQVQIRLLREGATVPRYMTGQAAGLDLAACLATPVTIAPGARALVGTGLAIELPEHYEAQVRPRSGLALKHGVTCLNSPGTIDADYRGEVSVLLVNLGAEPFVVKSGDRIAQLVVSPVTRVTLVAVENLSETARGSGGYGHTG